MVEQIYDTVNVFLREFFKTHRLRKERPHEAVGILIRSALPRVIGKREVHFHREIPLGFLVHRKLRSVVIGACFPQMFRAMFSKLLRGDAAHRLRGSILHFSSDEMTGSPFRKRGDGLFFAFAHDGIAFPMSEFFPTLNVRRPRINHALVRNHHFLVFLLPPALFPKEKVLPEFRMMLNPGVDGLRTNVRCFLFLVPPFCDLIGAPPFAQFLDDECFERHSLKNFSACPVGFCSSSLRMVLGDVGRVCKACCRVPFWFTREGGTVDTNHLCDLCLRCSQYQLLLNDDALVAREVRIRHDGRRGEEIRRKR